MGYWPVYSLVFKSAVDHLMTGESFIEFILQENL